MTSFDIIIFNCVVVEISIFEVEVVRLDFCASRVVVRDALGSLKIHTIIQCGQILSILLFC